MMTLTEIKRAALDFAGEEGAVVAADMGGSQWEVTMPSGRVVGVDASTSAVNGTPVFAAAEALAVLSATLGSGYDSAAALAEIRTRLSIGSDAEAMRRALQLTRVILGIV